MNSTIKALVTAMVMAVGLMAGVGFWPAPASADTCAPGTGVTVVVDHTGVPGGGGRGVDTDCVSFNGSATARSLFRSAGVSMQDTSRFPGLVCLVNSLPAPSPDCVVAPPSDAFWGLFWSNGRDGNWIYSSIGVDGLRVPQGGSIAWVWQGGNRTPPRVRPPAGSTLPDAGQTAAGPVSGPTNKPGRSPKPKANTRATPLQSVAVSPSASVTPSSTPSMNTPSANTPDPSVTKQPGTTQSSATPMAAATAEATKLGGPQPESSGLPVWIPVTLIVALSGAVGGAVWLRRRRG